jgi:hypothetical protein
MIRKDYLVRQLEEFGRVLAMIRSFLKNSDHDMFEKELGEAVRRFTSLELDFVEALSVTEFHEKVLGNRELSPEQKKMLADLLFEKLHMYTERNDEENILMLRYKCLQLYDNMLNSGGRSDYNLDIHYRIRYLNSF